MRRAAVPVVLAVVVLVAAVILLTSGGDDDYTVRAVYKDASVLRRHSAVKIAGVPAGEVTAIDLDRENRAVVTMRLHHDAGPIGAGATARIRPVNLLGEKYVDVNPGDLRRPLPSGATIPESRTGSPVELDDLLDMLDTDTRARLRILINEAGVGLAGRGADFNRLLDELPGSLDAVHALLGDLRGDTATIERAVARGDRVIGAVAGHRDQLGRLVTTMTDTLTATAARRRELGRTVATAPAGLGAFRDVLGKLGGAAVRLGPVSSEIRRAAPPLDATLRRLPTFQAAARAPLAEVQRTAPVLGRLGREGTPVVRRLSPTAARLSTFALALAPVVETFDRGDGMRQAMRFVNTWSDVIRNADGLGHVFRVRLIFSRDLIESAIGRYLGVDRLRRRPQARRPAAAPRPAETVRKVVPPPVRRHGESVGKVVDHLKKTIGDATRPLPTPVGRTTEKATQNAGELLDYLLGP